MEFRSFLHFHAFQEIEESPQKVSVPRESRGPERGESARRVLDVSDRSTTVHSHPEAQPDVLLQTAGQHVRNPSRCDTLCLQLTGDSRQILY